MTAKRTRAHYSFIAGEGDPQFERRADWTFWVNSAKSLKNMRLRNGGGIKRRPGLARVATLAGIGRLVPFTATDGTKRLVVLEPARYRVMETDETFETTVTSGMPWGSGDLGDLQADFENDSITVTSPSFFPHVLSRTLAGAWSAADLDWFEPGNGSVSQPYYRFPETEGITLTCAAVSGTGIVMTASAALFVAGHVGKRFQIYDREVEVVGYSTSTSVTVDIKQTLYPTLDITVASSVGFAVGDQVTTSSDEINGEVVSIVSGTVVRVNLVDAYTNPATTSNNLVGPTAKSAISAVATAAAVAGTTQWFEQLISSVRGYPGGNGYHRGRRCLYNFPQAPHVICASAQDETTDFNLGDASDADAVQASIGDAIGQQIRHMVSTEQMLVLTTVGPYYVGEGPGTPFTPTTVDFLSIGPEPASLCNPILSSEGIVYLDRDVARLLALAPTGNVRRSWDTGDLSDLAPHLLGGISRLCLVDGCEWGPERYVAAINEEGHLAMMHYRRGEEVLGWTPWVTDGEFVDVCVFNNKVYAVVKRGSSYYLERFDEDRLLDDSLLATGTSTITNTHWASAEREVVWRETVDGEDRRASLGYFTANGSGVISGLEAESRDYEVGRPIEIEIEPWPPIDPNRPLRSATRLSGVVVDLVDSGLFKVNETEVTPYLYGDDQEELPPLRTGYERIALLGLQRDPRVVITQPWAAPFEIRLLIIEAG